MKKAIVPACLLLLSACSLNRLALRSTAGLLQNGARAIYDEPDLQLAEDALPSHLELTRVLLQNDPDNRALLGLAAEEFNGYAFLFLEQPQPERAKDFYLRGRDFALRALAQEPRFRNLAGLNEAEMAHAMRAAGMKDVPDLFWAAFGWAGWINLSKDSPQALSQLPDAVAIMRRVQELSPDYHFAGPEIFFGVYYASRPAILGGNTAKAKDFFDRAIKMTNGEYLMDYVLEARYLAVALQDKPLFVSLLKRAQDSVPGRIPGAMLTDKAAQKEAGELLRRVDDYF
ncbi:MAG: hypothetical protein KGL04_01670 [Elusimicrobia bacterium]|nr:hypothetical protein [Elusimicrobiota bacterium]MDE2312868.1 hypothetical protein [Elusimicrobiota bacterium]